MIAQDTDWEKCISIYGTIGRQMLKKNSIVEVFHFLLSLFEFYLLSLIEFVKKLRQPDMITNDTERHLGSFTE